MPEWFEDPTFWDTHGPMMFNEVRRERAIEELDGLQVLLQLPEGASVCDLCCGPGRHAVELADRGFRVTAVDRHAPYLDELRAEGKDIEIVEADMREFVREGAFDAVVNLYSSFGYFEDPEDDRRVARNVRASLAPGGRFVIDTMSKEVLAGKPSLRRWERWEDGTLFLDETVVQPGWEHVLTTWILIRFDERLEHTFRHRLYSGVEMTTLLEDCGFSDVQLYGWFDGRPYDNEAKRMLAVAVA